VTANKYLSVAPQEDAPGKFEVAAVADFLASIPDDDDDRLAVARKFAALGLKLFPCRRDGKAPAIDGWQDAATDNPKTLRKWFGGSNPFNIGVSCAGLVVIDLDMKDGKDGLAAFKKLTGKTLDDFDTLIVETASGGYHVYLSGPPVANSVGKIGPGIDIRSAGGLVVGAGSAIGGKRYTIMRDRPVAAAPDWLFELITASETKAKPIKLTTAIELDTPAAIAFAAQYLEEAPASIEHDGGDANAYRVAARLKDIGLSESMAGSMMLGSWNDRCDPPWDEDELLEIIEHAYVYGQNSPGSASIEAEFEDLGPLDDASADRVDAANDNAPDDEFSALGETPADEAPKQGRCLVVLTEDDCVAKAATARPYIVKGVLSRRDFGAIVGKPGAGKSLLAPYLGHRINRGEPVFGRKTKPSTVLYLAVEDPHGMTQRVSALRGVYEKAPGFFLVTSLRNLLDNADRAALIELIKERRPDVIIIDTLARGFPGIDENSAAEMSKVVETCRGLTRGGAAVLIVHHNAKAGGDSARGSGVLDGDLDLRILVTQDEVTRVVKGEIGKNRSGSPEWKELKFTIDVREVGRDTEGDPITAAYAVERPDAETAAEEISDEDEAIYRLYMSPGISVHKLGKIVPGWNYSKAMRVVKALVKTGLAKKDKRGYLLTNRGKTLGKHRKDEMDAEFEAAA
jgi:hypothetical protein